MNKLILILTIISIISCDNKQFIVNEPDIDEHEECMERLFLLPMSKTQMSQKAIGRVGIHDFSIQDGMEDFNSKILFGTKFSSSNNSSSGGVSNISRFLFLYFLNNTADLGVGLFLQLSDSSTNFIVQNTFSTESIPLSTNLDSLGVELIIKNSCENMGMQLSSLYSSRNNQELIVEDFSYRTENDSVYYNLQIHAKNIELASRQYNDFDSEWMKEQRGEYNPVYDFELDTFNIKFSIAKD